MITKSQLRTLVDSNNKFKHVFELPWNETAIGRLYDTIDHQIEGGAVIDIISAKPIAFDLERETVMVEMNLNCSDLFDTAVETLADGD